MRTKIMLQVLIFLLISTGICSAEQWRYVGQYYNAMYFPVTVYFDLDSSVYHEDHYEHYYDGDGAGLSGGYSKSTYGSGGTLVRLVYPVNGITRSEIWNVNFTYNEDGGTGYVLRGYSLKYKINHQYIYNHDGYQIGEINGSDNEEETLFNDIDINYEVLHGVRTYAKDWPDNALLDVYTKMCRYINEKNGK